MGAVVTIACRSGARKRCAARSYTGRNLAKQFRFAALLACFIQSAPVFARMSGPLISIAKHERIEVYGTLPKLAAQRVPIGGETLDAPTGGVVWLPLSDLERVSRVAIQLSPGKRPRLFALTGFMDLLGSARRLGCSPDELFVA